MKSIAYNSGVAIGIMFGLVLCIFIFRAINKDKHLMTKYDEMQEKVRGKAYCYAFWTICAFEAMMCVFHTEDSVLPFNNMVIHFIPLMAGILVQIGYCVWNDAYVGLNTNMKRFAIFAVVISLVNFAVAFGAYKSGSLFTDGKLQSPFINLLCGFLFIFVAVLGMIKHLAGAREEE